MQKALFTVSACYQIRFILGLVFAFHFNPVNAKKADKNSRDNGGSTDVCPSDSSEVPKWPRSKTYKGLPFSAGEESKFELSYGAMNVHVGYGYIRVLPPVKHKIPVGNGKNGKTFEKRWHQVFLAEGFTGDWYKMIFQAHDKVQAFARPWDKGASRFYISQDENKPFNRSYRREKWLDYDHVNCQAIMREQIHHKNKEKRETHFLKPGAMDAVSALFRLRSHPFKVGKSEKFLVYTSEDNWWLKATPLKEETVEVKYGKHKAVVLKVHSYLGEELQQDGELIVWVAIDHPNRPLLKVKGQVKFGSFYIELESFKPGRSV